MTDVALGDTALNPSVPSGVGVAYAIPNIETGGVVVRIEVNEETGTVDTRPIAYMIPDPNYWRCGAMVRALCSIT